MVEETRIKVMPTCFARRYQAEKLANQFQIVPSQRNDGTNCANAGMIVIDRYRRQNDKDEGESPPKSDPSF
ncbi:hypothetical protein DTL42_25335 [Bremerella cremea]|uniref:Uncharacterized protein n=1 Tax=Bremerella cremea TaxID=1031537 RepID=A0A368KJE5_9BACT|nr:hypothetical protein DTL42_25335 [Bremerella cremea]